ncbi:MAG: patatin-like phospholipase family protein [Pseudomonadota bacterium]
MRASSSCDEKKRPRLGLALGSGAARGWAHVGALRAFDELNIDIDVYAGCSVGALVSAAKLLDIWEEFQGWARELSPIEAMKSFGLNLNRGGLIDPKKAFDIFHHADQNVEDLSVPWGAVATDLGTGEEVWLTQGSVLQACRASSAVPMIMQAVRYRETGQEHWLIDGAAANPVPVNLARALGAERIIAIDLNDHIHGPLKRFNRPTTRAVVPVAEEPAEEGPFQAIETFIKTQSQDITRRLALAKAQALSRPQFLETAIATTDIIQAQLARARAQVDIADLRITPNLSMGSAASFDLYEIFEQEGYRATMAAKEDILSIAERE